MTDDLAVKPTADMNDDELNLIQKDLSASDEKLINFVRFKGGAWRGLPFDILQKHGCKYIEQWTSPTSRLQKKYSTPTARVLIPAGDSGYLARLAVSLDEFDERTQKYIHEKEHAGTKQLFNADVLNADEPIFAVEGYIDALSVEFAGFKAVALGGRNRGDLLVKAVAKKEKKPQIIILLDADKSGRESAPEIFDALIDVGCPCVIRFLTADESKIDCNQILAEQGLDALRGILQDIYDNSLAELDAVARELAKEENSRLSDDILNSIFNGDASDLDFARRFEQVFGDCVRWLKDSERWLTFANGIWTRGSEKNSCLLPFTREVADLMTQYAENKDERALADRLKSTRKILSSITALKSLDSILITQDDLDTHSSLLSVLNGVVDLETGILMNADPTKLITRQCRAEYHANAHSELVDKFFRDIQPDEMTRAGLLRWLGYCLTGENSEEKFLVWHGGGKNGKGVLSGTMLELSGSYGVGLTPRALLKSNRPVDADKATTALNALEGVRFAISEELPADAELDASLVKNLTGGDKINLRGLYGEYRTIPNFAKLNVSGNYLPRLENTSDDGILRRLLNMPFTVKFGVDAPADPALKKKMLLPENLNALLAILVREAVNWYRCYNSETSGLIISQLMKQETARHLEQSNFVSDFIADNYPRDRNHEIKAKDFIDKLRTEYPRETSRFKRADLIKLITSIDGVTYGEDNYRNRVIKIAKTSD